MISAYESKLEARVGIEPTHRGFADLGLTTWLPRPSPLRGKEGSLRVFEIRLTSNFGSEKPPLRALRSDSHLSNAS